MPNLQATIQSLASSFASELIAAVRGMSLAEVLNLQGATSAPSRGTRTAADATKTVAAPKAGGAVGVDAIVAAVKKHRNGVAGDVLRKELGGPPKPAFYYQMNKALAAKRVRKTGIKRATLYFATR